MKPFQRSFFARDALEVAPQLLNALIVAEGAVARIVEVEAYRGANDPASHAFRGQTPRNRSMFGPPGHLYVYFTYGIHYCANVVCASPGEASAVLLRALVPLEGLELMRSRRPRAQSDRDLCSGPGKLCQALGIGREFDGVDLVGDPSSPLSLARDGVGPPDAPIIGPRIGLGERTGEARTFRWRFRVESA